jgi:RNA polymerase primary sigma factor
MSTEALSTYYELISKQPLLSVEEERELVNTIFFEDCSELKKKRARDKLITANLRFVFQAARRRAKKGDQHQFEELVCLGNEGLLKGLEKFNPSAGVRFLSYAGWWVMQHQLRGQAHMRLVALPVGKQQLSLLIQKEVDQLGRKMTTEELKERFPKNGLKELIELQEYRYLTSYIEDEDSQESFHTSTLEDDILDMIEKEELYAAIAKLPEVYSVILISHFGLEDEDKRNLQEIAKKLDLTPERVRRLIPKAFKRLQETFLGTVVVP